MNTMSKRWWFSWMWLWDWKDIAGFTPFSMSFDYDKWEPSMSFEFVILNVGFSITWLCPWDTEQSKYSKEYSQEVSNLLDLGEATQLNFPFSDTDKFKGGIGCCK